jgi:UDP-2,3-diacylglucosamine pyrophosphatase LpxH
MSTIKVVISDLHLADGTSILDCFGDRQQAALEGLLAAAASPLSQAESVELIINGDCFDFLVTTSYTTNNSTNAATAVQKIFRIIAAHQPFFAALHTFIDSPGRRVTFTTGNHDLELCFSEVRTAITAAITGKKDTTEDERVYFCPTRFYRPLPDVYIEHGNYYDFWNHAVQGLWDAQGQPLNRNPSTLFLSVGSTYFQRAAYPISIQHAYFDHFDPPLNSVRQIALLCLLNPELVADVVKHTMQLLSYPRQPLENISLLDRRNPVRLFEEAIQDFSAFQSDMVAQKRDWTPIQEEPEQEISQADIAEFMLAHSVLSLTPVEAVAALCVPTTYAMGEEVAIGMHNVLSNDPTLRYAIAGHTHQLRFDPGSDERQTTYFNTSSWTNHLALPNSTEVTPELVSWLQAPDWRNIPLRDITQFPFVLVTSSPNELSHASLCAWEGGIHGDYRILVEA